MKDLNFFLKLKNLLYIYQQEGYEKAEFIAWTKRHRERIDLERKKKLHWTLKARLIYALALGLIFGPGLILVVVSASYSVLWIALIGWLVYLFFGPLEYALVASNFLLTPLDYYLRSSRIKQAKEKLKSLPNLNVVGITGSYGKTTTARFLTTILSEKYRVLQGVSSYNTPLGVSKVILDHLQSEHEVLVVEMGADHPGDIKELSDMVKPEIGVLSGINEAHLEKFKTIEITIKTKFELAEALPENGFLVVNGSDENIVANLDKFRHPAVESYTGAGKKDGWSYNNYLFDGSGVNFDIIHEGKKYLSDVRAAVLGRHNIGNILLAVSVANRLGLTATQIKSGIEKITRVEHRLALKINPNGIKIIDDSYNGNPTGVRAALDVLAEFVKERKIFFTPGLVEVGEAQKSIHVGLGQDIAAVADLVILTKNSNTPFFLEGFEKAHYPKEKIIIFNSSQEAYNGLGDILKSGDVILFQNDWTDNYD